MIRHGATKANEEHRYLGKTDEPLLKEGEEKLRKYKKRKYYPDIDVLFISLMRRCVQTAEILYPKLQPVSIEEWKEIDFGAFEGKNCMDLQGDERYQAWIDSNGMLPFPEGESREEFIRRCEKGFHRMVEEVRQREEYKTIGMVVHGGTIMALLSKYGGGDYFDYQVANGEGYVCTVKNWDNEPEIIEIKKI